MGYHAAVSKSQIFLFEALSFQLIILFLVTYKLSDFNKKHFILNICYYKFRNLLLILILP
jgi:hypothetical protein